MKLRFTLRDLGWLAIVVALATCWWLSEQRNAKVQQKAEQKIIAHDKGWKELLLMVKPEPHQRPTDFEISEALRRYEEREAKERQAQMP